MCDNPPYRNCKRLFALLRSEPHHLLELTQPEMLDISLWINREFAPRFSTPMVKNTRALSFAAQELLSISAEISREFTPLNRGVTANLVLLPIDPQHLHAYWRLEQREPSAQPPLDAMEDLTLRIFTQPSVPVDSPVAIEGPAWFDVRVNQAESHQAVELPAKTAFSGAFSAALGVQQASSQDFTPILVSNFVEMPKHNWAGADPDQENAVLSTAVAQFILPVLSGSSSVRKPLC